MGRALGRSCKLQPPQPGRQLWAPRPDGFKVQPLFEGAQLRPCLLPPHLRGGVLSLLGLSTLPGSPTGTGRFLPGPKPQVLSLLRPLCPPPQQGCPGPGRAALTEDPGAGASSRDTSRSSCISAYGRGQGWSGGAKQA